MEKCGNGTLETHLRLPVKIRSVPLKSEAPRPPWICFNAHRRSLKRLHSKRMKAICLVPQFGTFCHASCRRRVTGHAEHQELMHAQERRRKKKVQQGVERERDHLHSSVPPRAQQDNSFYGRLVNQRVQRWRGIGGGGRLYISRPDGKIEALGGRDTRG
ncbi:unnamed protein product [Pleuronectes platessa]|uniref:Uncharacterized protein n=1 Tax=Pleuronectes platessa TaxID=8262 RepID=A0A9N7TLU2_PLEPL|nr:unnamed protein product [Pleuronectes platessa]